MNLRITNRSIVKNLTLAVAGSLGLLAYAHFVMVPGYSSLIEEIQWRTKSRRVTEVAPAGDHHKALQMVADFPGVTEPSLIESKATALSDNADVFGIVINGQAYAFARNALVIPAEHVVNLLIDQKPVSVTYCDLVDCVRVLTRAGSHEAIDLHIGGLDVANQMVLLLNGIRYGQSSKGIPLQDLPFERTTLGEWKLLHPTTMIYEG